MALRPSAFAPEASKCAECADGFKDAAPHGVEVDGRCHHGNDYFVGSKFGNGNLADVDALTRVLLITWNPIPHGLVFLTNNGCSIGVGQWQGGDFFASGAIENGLKDVFHSIDDSEFP